MGYGGGTLFQRGKKGIWYYQAWVEGKQIGPFSSQSTERKAAQNKLDALLGKRARGEIGRAPADTRIKHLVADFLEYADANLEESTASGYKSLAERQIIPAFGHIKPQALTTNHLKQYRKRRESEPKTTYRRNGQPIVSKTKLVSASTVNRELSLLRAALNYSLETNPALAFLLPHFPMVREDKNIRQGFTDEDNLRALIDALPYPGVRAMTAVSYLTGVRKGELSKLNWPQVDFETRMIHIAKTKNHDPREIPIFAGLMEEYLLAAKRERDELWPECEAVFAFNGERLLNPKRSWNTARNKAKLPDLLFHDMRRSANRNMRNFGAPQAIRMKVMGQLTPSMDRRYGIVDRTDMEILKDLQQRQQEAKTTAKTTANRKLKGRKSA